MKISNTTKTYLNKIKKNINYLGCNAGWDSMQDVIKKAKEKGNSIKNYKELETIKLLDILGQKEIIIGTYCSNEKVRYFIEFGYPTDIDDFCIETLIFFEKPTIKEFHIVKLINNMESGFSFGRISEEIQCWECGNKTHWTNIIADSFQEKCEMAKENYCGC